MIHVNTGKYRDFSETSNAVDAEISMCGVDINLGSMQLCLTLVLQLVSIS